MRKTLSFLIAFVLAICSLQIAFASSVNTKAKQVSVIADISTVAAVVVKPQIISRTDLKSFPAGNSSPNYFQLKNYCERKGFKNTFRQSIFYPPEQIKRE